MSPSAFFGPSNTTSVHPIVRIRRNASWDCSPWAEAAGANTTVVAMPNRNNTASLFIISVPPLSSARSARLPLLQEAADGPDRQHSSDELADPVAADGDGGPE